MDNISKHAITPKMRENKTEIDIVNYLCELLKKDSCTFLDNIQVLEF